MLELNRFIGVRSQDAAAFDAHPEFQFWSSVLEDMRKSEIRNLEIPSESLVLYQSHDSKRTRDGSKQGIIYIALAIFKLPDGCYAFVKAEFDWEEQTECRFAGYLVSTVWPDEYMVSQAGMSAAKLTELALGKKP